VAYTAQLVLTLMMSVVRDVLDLRVFNLRQCIM